jgi:hypothetical protein
VDPLRNSHCSKCAALFRQRVLVVQPFNLPRSLPGPRTVASAGVLSAATREALHLSNWQDADHHRDPKHKGYPRKYLDCDARAAPFIRDLWSATGVLITEDCRETAR